MNTGKINPAAPAFYLCDFIVLLLIAFQESLSQVFYTKTYHFFAFKNKKNK